MDAKTRFQFEAIEAAHALECLKELQETLREWEAMMENLAKDLPGEGSSIPSHIWSFGITAQGTLDVNLAALRDVLSSWEKRLRRRSGACIIVRELGVSTYRE